MAKSISEVGQALKGISEGKLRASALALLFKIVREMSMDAEA